jgi:hypothetical protein
MKDSLKNNHKYMINRRQEIARALKETLRINKVIKNQKEEATKRYRLKMRQDAGKSAIHFFPLR